MIPKEIKYNLHYDDVRETAEALPDYADRLMTLWIIGYQESALPRLIRQSGCAGWSEFTRAHMLSYRKCPAPALLFDVCIVRPMKAGTKLRMHYGNRSSREIELRRDEERTVTKQNTTFA